MAKKGKASKVVKMETPTQERSEALKPTMIPLKDLMALAQSVNILINTPGLTGQELYWGKRSLKQIESAMKTARAVSQEVVEAFAKKDKDGKPIINFEENRVEFNNKEDEASYNAELEVRFSEALEVNVYKFAQHVLMGTRFTQQVPDVEMLMNYCAE